MFGFQHDNKKTYFSLMSLEIPNPFYLFLYGLNPTFKKMVGVWHVLVKAQNNKLLHKLFKCGIVVLNFSRSSNPFSNKMNAPILCSNIAKVVGFQLLILCEPIARNILSLLYLYPLLLQPHKVLGGTIAFDQSDKHLVVWQHNMQAQLSMNSVHVT
jgi:hypothetical protein